MIESNEKFSLLSLPRVSLTSLDGDLVLSNGLRVMRTLPLSIEDHWQRWIGEIRVNELQDAGCYLLVTGQTSSPEILDADNQELMQRICGFLDALLIVETPYCAASPFLLTGANVSGEIRIRQVSNLHTPIRHRSAKRRTLQQRDFEQAVIVAGSLTSIISSQIYMRLKRAISAFLAGIHDTRHDERLHQFCRCIDGIVLSGKGSGKKDFKSRTALFIGAVHEAVAEEIYEMRSAVEHLRPAESEAVGCANLKAQRMRVIERALQAEIIARHCLNRILLSADLLLRFENDEQIKQFWGMSEDDRRKAWGALSIDTDLAQVVEPRFVENDDLGLPPSNEESCSA